MPDTIIPYRFILRLMLILSVIPVVTPIAVNAQDVPPETTELPDSGNDPAIQLALEGVTGNEQWKPYLRDIDGVDMMLVPAGCFQMGNVDNSVNGNADGGEQCFDTPFWIDRYEVTNAQLAEFLNANGNQSLDGDIYLDSEDVDRRIHNIEGLWVADEDFENHPAIEISWYGARDYCVWRSGRLPTEAEWEYAARGVDTLIYPFGNEWHPDKAVWNSAGTAIVGSIPEGASWVGAMDMSGNVWEWTVSPFIPYPYDAENEDPDNRDISRVMRGGSWYISNEIILSSASRMASSPDVLNDTGGFRCMSD